MVAKNKQNNKPTLTHETMMALAGFDQRDAHNGNDVLSNMWSGSSWLDSPFYTCLKTWRQCRTCISWARGCWTSTGAWNYLNTLGMLLTTVLAFPILLVFLLQHQRPWKPPMKSMSAPNHASSNIHKQYITHVASHQHTAWHHNILMPHFYPFLTTTITCPRSTVAIQ